MEAGKYPARESITVHGEAVWHEFCIHSLTKLRLRADSLEQVATLLALSVSNA